VAHALADNTAILRTLHRIGPAGEPDHDGTMISVTLPVDRRQPVTDETPAASGSRVRAATAGTMQCLPPSQGPAGREPGRTARQRISSSASRSISRPSCQDPSASRS
jgi:hypothetical protein